MIPAGMKEEFRIEKNRSEATDDGCVPSGHSDFRLEFCSEG